MNSFENKNEEKNLLLSTSLSETEKILSILVFMVGVFVKSGPLLVILSCKDLSIYFKEKNNVTLYQISLFVFSFLTKWIHVRFLLRIVHGIKITITSSLSIIGCLFIIIALQISNFDLSLFGSILLGISFTVSDTLCLGLLKSMNPLLVGSYLSGQGFSGLFFSILYLIFQIYKIEIFYFFLLNIPVYILLILFFWILLKTQIEIDKKNGMKFETIELSYAEINENLSFSNFSFVLKNQYYYFIMFGLNAFISMSIIGFLSIDSIDRETMYPLFVKEGYPILMVIYRFSAFLAKSTLSYFKISKIYIGLLLNFKIMIAFIFFAEGLLVSPYVLCFLMVLVGFFEGLCYLNICYMILNDSKIPKKFKEISMNLNSLFFDIGIVLSGVFGLIFARI